jgi:hypothetical protein
VGKVKIKRQDTKLITELKMVLCTSRRRVFGNELFYGKKKNKTFFLGIACIVVN